MSFTLTATMKGHVNGETLAGIDYDIVPTPYTTVDSGANVVRSGGKTVRTNSQGKFTVTLASGENLFYTVRRSYGPERFNAITFKAPDTSGGVIDLADVVQVKTPDYPAPVVTGRGISSITNSPTDQDVLIITYTDGTTDSIDVPAGSGAVDSVNGQVGVVSLDAADVGARPDTYNTPWGDIPDKPSTFPPDLTGVTASTIGAQPAGSYVTTNDSRLSDARTPLPHAHSADDVNEGVFDISRIPTGVTAQTVAFGNHTHSQYVTNSALTTALSGKANVSHTHAIGDVTGLQSALDGIDFADAPPLIQQRDASDSGPRWRTDLTADLSTSQMDISRHYVNGTVASWQNEWGALRGTAPYEWGDALVRGVRNNTDGIYAGRFIELVDRRSGAGTNPMYGRKWRDGVLVRNGIDMADVWVRSGNDPIPSELPPGTVVVQI